MFQHFLKQLSATIIWKQGIISEKYSKKTNTYFKSTIKTLDSCCFYVFPVNIELFPPSNMCAFVFVVAVVVVVAVFFVKSKQILVCLISIYFNFFQYSEI